MPINANGFWEGTDKKIKEGHCYDKSLASHLVTFFKNEQVTSLVDLGCGDGKYVKMFQENEIRASGYDGNPDTPGYTNNLCGVLDLAVPYQFEEPFDWVMSLEVGEHLPPKFEDIFIGNLHNNNKNGIVMSWAIEGQSGYGHFNVRNNDYIKAKICALGYTNDVESENQMRKKSSLRWFKNTIMVFRKNRVEAPMVQII
jgi:cyclopropane fatty-acyl-phospholipid synthase-like methyltransferase